MKPEQPSSGELSAHELAPESRRRIGDHLETLARARLARRRWLRLGTAGAVLAATALLLVWRPKSGTPSRATATHLRTASGDFQLLPLGERGVAFVSEDTDVELVPGGRPALRIHHGSVRLVIQRQHDNPFVVVTPSAEVAVTGTEFDVIVRDQRTEVHVVRGEVEVRNRQGRRRLWAREAARVDRGQPPFMLAEQLTVDGPSRPGEASRPFPRWR
jgi:ferric-dicitrate binding protein FerR (iron transport regulator)